MAAERQWNEALFRALTQHSGDILSLLDAQGRFLFNSAAAVRISGYGPEELAAMGPFQSIHPDDLATVAETFQRVLAEPGATASAQYRYRTKGGGWTWMEAVACNQLDNPDVRGVVTSSRDITERKRTEDALRQGEERLRALAARLDALREEEQARISRDLHDDLAQVLAGLGFEFRRLENRLGEADAPPWLEDWLAEASSLVGQAHASVRRIAFDLRPPSLDALGLPQALAAEARRFEARTGIRCAVEVGEFPALPAPVATALYRIAQEALTNVARHAQAAQVRLRLEAGGGEVVLRVEDDGRGPAEGDQARAGLGLLGMRERAAQVGGTARLERGAAGGATVVARLPLALHSPR